MIKLPVGLSKQAFKRWGKTAQEDVLVEECAELIKAVMKIRRGCTPERIGDLLDELADVEMMIEQMRFIYGDYGVDVYKGYKIERLRKRLQETKR